MRVLEHPLHVPGVHDLLSPALSALLGLAEEGELNMRRFAVAARVSPASARAILAKLEEMGLVETTREAQGATSVATIRLTPLGRAVAEHARGIHRLVAAGHRR